MPAWVIDLIEMFGAKAMQWLIAYYEKKAQDQQATEATVNKIAAYRVALTHMKK